MKRACFVCLFLCLTTTFLLSQSNSATSIHQNAAVVSPIDASQADPKAQAKILDGYGKLPLSFEANRGQTDARVKFLSRTGGYTLFLSGDEAVFTWSGKKVRKTSAQSLKPTSLAVPNSTAKRAAGKPATGESAAGEPAAGKPAKGEPAKGEPAVGKPRFASGYRFSDTASSPKLESPSGAGQRPSTVSADPAVIATGGMLRMKLRNANSAAKVTGVDQLAGTSNYFIGNDPAKWRTNVPTYAKVKYEGIYSGIDLVYYGNQRQLEYDFIVTPGADPRRIAFDISGAQRIRKDEHGDLVLKMKTGEDEIRWHKPVVYQEKDGARQVIAARYAITDKSVGFAVAKYDASRPLYIDPLIYSTFLGGSDYDNANGIAVDSSGNAYVTGQTISADFPTTPGAFQQSCGSGCITAFVAKINATGSALVYSTYLGGSGAAGGNSIAVDSAGNAYVTGGTYLGDFPTTPGAFQTVCNGGAGCSNYTDAFVTKINPTGSALVYSTYLGGSGDDGGGGIAVDSAGNAYVTGNTSSSDFPTKNPFQPANGGNDDAFVSKINATGSALTYSTYLGGSGKEFADGIAVDSSGNAYVAGYTESTDFPTMNPLQPANGGNGDAFVSKINAAGSALVYSTFLGGSSDDVGYGIVVDGAGHAYVSGTTASTDFPTKNPLQGANAGGFDIFVAKINAAGSALVYSTYIGDSGVDSGTGIAVDSARNAYVTGYTTSSIDFPTTTNAVQPTFGGGFSDAFVIKLNPTGSALLYSSYLGGSDIQGGFESGSGIAVDSSGNPYVAGTTAATNFPLKNPLQPTYGGGGEDAFVAKTSVPVETPTTTTLSSSLNPSIYGQAVTFTAVVTSSIGAPPDGETVTFMEGTTILGTGALSGGSASFTTSTLPVGTHSIKAVYGGDSKFLGSKSNAVSQAVSKATSTTTLASSRNPSSFGQSVTFTAMVAPQYRGTPSGMVKFLNGATVLATKTLSAGTARFATSKLPLGSNMITAVYGGDSNFASGTSAPVNQVVLTATTTTLSSSLNPSTYGQAVTFTAFVTSNLGAPPDGETVKFMKGTTVLGTGTLSGGSASFTTSTLTAGTDDIKAAYGGDSIFAPSTSKALSQVVNRATTTTTLVSSQNPSNFGQAVTFTANVAPQFSGTVKGTVTFYDGTTALATVFLSKGAAKFTTSTLAQGTHAITATYNGNASFIGSSASLTQTVN